MTPFISLYLSRKRQLNSKLYFFVHYTAAIYLQVPSHLNILHRARSASADYIPYIAFPATPYAAASGATATVTSTASIAGVVSIVVFTVTSDVTAAPESPPLTPSATAWFQEVAGSSFVVFQRVENRFPQCVGSHMLPQEQL